MKISNKQADLQQIAFSHSSDIDLSDIGYRDFMKFIIFLGILASDNPLGFRKNLSERI